MLKIAFKTAMILAAATLLPAGAFAKNQAPAAKPAADAPAFMTSSQNNAWQKLNNEEAKLAKRRVDLDAEMADDISDVAEASKNLLNAQAKLDKEQADLDKTAGQIDQSREKMLDIENRRTALRAKFAEEN